MCDIMKYKKYGLEKSEVGRIWQYGKLPKFKQEVKVKKRHANIKQSEIQKKIKIVN